MKRLRVEAPLREVALARWAVRAVRGGVSPKEVVGS